MEIRNLEYFFETAKLGNFSRAADKLAVSQPALSLGVKKLEKELKCKLLKRGKKTLLTAEGERLQQHCSKLFELLNEIKEDLNMVSKGIRGKIKAGILESALLYIFPEIVAGFTSKYPDINLKFEKAETLAIEKAVQNAELDFGIISRVSNSKKLEDIKLTSYAHSLVVSANDKRKIKVLARETKLYLSGEWQTGAIKHYTNLLDRFPKIKILNPVNCVAMLRQFVALGHGMAILPDYVLSDDLRVIEAYPQLQMPIYLIKPKRTESNAIINQFIDYIINNV